MTVRELINELENYRGDMEVVMQPYNSSYAHEISKLKTKELRSSFGEDRKVIAIMSDGQEGLL